MLQGILLAVIVILLLVVLIPVGIALFQRLRPERTPVGPREKAAPPPPPVQNIPTSKGIPALAEVPTDKVSRQPAAPPPPDLTPSAAPAVAPSSDRTRIPEPSDVTSGTEMMQWYGMLNCTAGPLEGQRFIIEDEGFYIGRDPALAKVVVPDTRVSKRHLRIVPRDGKVWAIDQGSTNGTFIGGQRITEVQLKRGDTLILGDNAATFVYQV